MSEREIKYIGLESLFLDPKNPRLGREFGSKSVSQDDILKEMDSWVLDELGESFVESGFWVQEALIVVREKTSKNAQKELVVVEGNRRLAALKRLFNAIHGSFPDRRRGRWEDIALNFKSKKPTPVDFKRIPYIEMPSREDVVAFLGFRHVTGIQQWRPTEKAEYITSMIDDHQMRFDEVAQKIGSKAPTVRQNYITFKLLQKLEVESEEAGENVKKKFSVLFLLLGKKGIKEYLGIEEDFQEIPATQNPKKILGGLDTKHLVFAAKKIFGTEDAPPLLEDSRNADKIGEIFESQEALNYLAREKEPKLETAYRYAGGESRDALNNLRNALDLLKEATGVVVQHKDNDELIDTVKRIHNQVETLMNILKLTR